MIKFIENIGDYFSSNYFDEDFVKKVHDKSGYSFDDYKELQKKISSLKDKYFKYKQSIIEGRLRVKDKIYETYQFHTNLLNALGFDGDKTNYDTPFHFSESEVIPVRHILYKGNKPHLMIMEIQPLIKVGDEEPDGLFEQRYNEEGETTPEQRYHRSQWSRVFKISKELTISPAIINKCISKLALIDQNERPHYIMVLGGNIVYLIEVEKWFRGSYLSFNIEELFDESSVDRRYYSLFYLLLSKEMLSPDSELVLMDQLDEDSHKSAYEVTKDLKEGIINAVELLANESLFYQKDVQLQEFDESDDTFEQQVKDDCLNIIYRLLFVFYAESRPELEILPITDQVYQRGYSLEMLRDLEQTQLITDHSRNGYFFHESLSKLFLLMSSGYREGENGRNKSFKIRHIDSPFFDDRKLNHLGEVKFRNFVWQDVICQLSLSKKQRGKARGRISYANLGINQLGSVYESLLAYRGFFAEQDYIEVHTKNKPQDGTYLVQRSRRDDFHVDEVLKDENGNEVIIKKGRFVYRLSGRDRQKSASYYTPEVLTQTTVKYTLKSILEKVEKGDMSSLELLDLKLLEPAMGAAAFHNELINQLSEAYLNYRQKELKQKISPEKYREELQRVKAYIATNNTYGVDINPTAIELGKLSLWLNVIHKDMETPFFANRLAVGNAVVGAWFKTFKTKELKGKWWECEPKMVSFKNGKINRSKDRIYHFLLPDKNMVPSAGIKLLKEEDPDRSKRITEWKKQVCKPITEEEIAQLNRICDTIDALVVDYFKFQKMLNSQTRNKLEIWGGIDTNEQFALNLRSYDEKEQLNDQRNRQSAPYYKLKMVMDYWCSLWFWDMRKAEYLPTRQQYLNDLTSILSLDLIANSGEQLGLDFGGSILMEAQSQIIRKTDQGDLFDEKERLSLVKKLSANNRFFHNQLEFIEVFLERGGFDVIVGNPPWVKITFEEKNIISEKFPEILLRKTTAPRLKQIREKFLEDSFLKTLYELAEIETESVSVFMNSVQNYPLLVGQQTNLYKCVIENGYAQMSRNGFLGLLHPEGIFEDPKGQIFRYELYKRIKYHFQFLNELFLFQDVGHRMLFSINVYSGEQTNIEFTVINNLFHPATIDGCFIHNGTGICGGFKVKDEALGKFVWNTKPHRDRIISCTEKELQLFATLFENTDEHQSVKMINIQSKSIINVLERIASFQGKVFESEKIITVGWDETNAINKEIVRGTRHIDIGSYEFIFSGPHFHVANPLNKTPRSICTEKAHYDVIDLTLINDKYFSRTNYIPNIPIKEYIECFKGFEIGESENGETIHDNWIEYYKVGFSKMLNTSSERTLQPAILPRKTSHINGVISVTFRNQNDLIEFTGLSSSIVFDFLIKTIGTANLTYSRIVSLPMGISESYYNPIFLRTLLLNCVSIDYSDLWESNFNTIFIEDSWSKNDKRLSSFNYLAEKWNWDIPVRNSFARRWALVEIDVISAMAFNLTLEELLSIYNISFPLMQQYEDETYYDQNGRIVFTVNRGLTGVGLERSTWETIKDLKEGETYEHTIEKSELYYGQKVIYYAPFDKCDRVEDYKVAWAHFERVFNKEDEV